MVGGGGVANRKARKLLQARAEVVVISPEVKPELESVAAEVWRRAYRDGDLDGAFLAFAATDVREVNAAVAREAGDRNIPVNVADEPSDGDFVLPSTLRRGRLQVAVSTGGASPVLARRVKDELEGLFGPEWAGLVEGIRASRRAAIAEGETSEGVGERSFGDLGGEVDRCLSRLRG